MHVQSDYRNEMFICILLFLPSSLLKPTRVKSTMDGASRCWMKWAVDEGCWVLAGKYGWADGSGWLQAGLQVSVLIF